MKVIVQKKALWLILVFFSVIVGLAVVQIVEAACSGTDTFTLFIENSNGTQIHSSSASITNTTADAQDCGTDVDTIDLYVKCWVNDTYKALINCSGCGHSGISYTTVLICRKPSQKQFKVINNAKQTVAIFDEKGDIYLKGLNFSSQSGLMPPANSFVIKDKNGLVVAFIDSNGNLNMTGRIFMNQNLTINSSRSSFIIRNQSNADVAYINSSGDIALLGRLYANYSGTT